MSPEEKQLLEKVSDQVNENNKILRSMRRSQRVGVVLRVFYWLLIIGLSLGAFYFIQPYIDMLKNITNGNAGQALSQSASDSISNLLKKL